MWWDDEDPRPESAEDDPYYDQLARLRLPDPYEAALHELNRTEGTA